MRFLTFINRIDRLKLESLCNICNKAVNDAGP